MNHAGEKPHRCQVRTPSGKVSYGFIQCASKTSKYLLQLATDLADIDTSSVQKIQLV
jgi:hypothetical protein